MAVPKLILQPSWNLLEFNNSATIIQTWKTQWQFLISEKEPAKPLKDIGLHSGAPGGDWLTDCRSLQGFQAGSKSPPGAASWEKSGQILPDKRARRHRRKTEHRHLRRDFLQGVWRPEKNRSRSGSSGNELQGPYAVIPHEHLQLILIVNGSSVSHRFFNPPVSVDGRIRV
jgi:hypothetical protein